MGNDGREFRFMFQKIGPREAGRIVNKNSQPPGAGSVVDGGKPPDIGVNKRKGRRRTGCRRRITRPMMFTTTTRVTYKSVHRVATK